MKGVESRGLARNGSTLKKKPTQAGSPRSPKGDTGMVRKQKEGFDARVTEKEESAKTPSPRARIAC